MKQLAAALMAVLVSNAALAQQATPAPTLVVYAAGSLRAALVDVATAFEATRPVKVAHTFGASGLLKNRIAAGEAAQVFASANMAHPQALAASGQAVSVTAFARNKLCVLATPAFSLQGKTLAQRLLDADVKLGTSTPVADPSGDYAFAMFDRIEAAGATGAAQALKAKALQLTGGPNSPAPPAGRSVYAELVAAGQADAFVTYCTGARQAQHERPALQVLAVPDAINVAADYGVALLRPAGAEAQAYLQFLLGPQGQAILAAQGFSSPP